MLATSTQVFKKNPKPFVYPDTIPAKNQGTSVNHESPNDESMELEGDAEQPESEPEEDDPIVEVEDGASQHQFVPCLFPQHASLS